MVINETEIEEIQVITSKNELIASITDKNIIEKDNYKVVCIPAVN